jgi:uncharacterized protein (TIRG00374 family)
VTTSPDARAADGDGDRDDRDVDTVDGEILADGLTERQLLELSSAEGTAALAVPEKLIEDELRAKSPVRRTVETAGSLLVVVAIFAVLIPRVFDTSYTRIAEQLRALDGVAVAVLASLWLVNIATVWAMLTQALPGLRFGQAAVLNLSGSAVANAVPFGGAVGIGATFAQCLSWGFDTASVALSVLVSGVWNVFAKLSFPIAALGLLTIYGESARGLELASFVGVAMVVTAVAVFVAVMRSERLAEWAGRTAQRPVDAVRRLLRWAPSHDVSERVLDFRHRTRTLVERRWMGLTVWMVAYKVSSFFLELACVRAIGIGADEVSWVEVLAAYAFGELLTAIPLTPSGVGFVETGNAGLLVAFGAPDDAALAAVFLFRAFDYLIEIPAGGAAWVVWATKHSWRRPVGSMPVLA